MGGGGGTKTTSTNPAWVDKGGEQLYNFGINSLFGQPSTNDYYSKALAPWGYKPPTSSSTMGGTSSAKPGNAAPNPMVSTPNPYITPKPTAGVYNPDPFGFGKAYPQLLAPNSSSAGAAPSAPAASGGTMSFDNIRDLPMYPGQRVADISKAERQGIELAKSSAGVSNGNFGQAEDAYGQSMGAAGAGYGAGMKDLSFGRSYIPASTERYSTQFGRAPDAMSTYMNPFVEGSLDVTARKMKQDYEQGALRDQELAKSRGAFGGSRSALAESQKYSDFGRNLGDMYSTGLSNAYDKAGQLYQTDEQRLTTQDNTEKDRMQHAADLLRQFGSTDSEIGSRYAGDLRSAGEGYTNVGKAREDSATAAVNRLLGAGKLDTDFRQKQKDVDYANFVEQRDHPMSVIQQLAAILNGNKGSMQTTQGGNSAAQTLGGFGALLGGGAQLYSALGPAAAVAASDRRLKTEIVRVGKHDIPGKGDVPLYRFRYAGDKTRTYHTGVMADEVEPLMPEAVHVGIDGMKMVDYGAVGLEFR